MFLFEDINPHVSLCIYIWEKNPIYKFEKKKKRSNISLSLSLTPFNLIKKSFGIWFPGLVFQKAGYDQLASSKADQISGPFKKFHLQIKIVICAFFYFNLDVTPCLHRLAPPSPTRNNITSLILISLARSISLSHKYINFHMLYIYIYNSHTLMINPGKESWLTGLRSTTQSHKVKSLANNHDLCLESI